MGFIDIEACAGIVTRMREIADDVALAQTRLRSQADHVDLDAPSLRDLGADVAEVRRMASDLRARVDLAITIESTRSESFHGTAQGVVQIPNSSGDDLLGDLAEALATAAKAVDVQDEKSRAWLAGTLSQYDGNAQFAAAFLTDLGAGQMLDLMARTAYADNTSPDEDQRTILTSLRSMLRLADTRWDPHERETFGQELVRAATWQDPTVAGRNHAASYSAGLAYLLTDRAYSPELSVGVARELEEYERSTLSTADNPESAWFHRAQGANPFLAYTPGPHQSGQPGDLASTTWDPSAALMSSLARNPKAALAVFSRDANGTDVTPALQYWLADRTWNQDKFALLSTALLAATIDPAVVRDSANDEQRAIVTAAAINLIGTRPDIDRDHLTDPSGTSIAANNFARLLGENMIAADYATWMKQRPDNNATVETAALAWFGNGKLGAIAAFDAARPGGDAGTLSPLARFAVLASSTEESTVLLRTAVDRYAAFKYGVALGDLGDSLRAEGTVIVTGQGETQLRNHPKQALTDAWVSQAMLEGMLTQAVGRTDINEAARDDARNAVWVGMVTDTIGLVPYADTTLKAMQIPEGFARRTLKLGMTKAQGNVLKSLVSNEEAQAVDDATGAAALALERGQYQLAMSMLASGIVPDDLAAPLQRPDSTPVSLDEYLDLGASPWGNLTNHGAFGTLTSTQEFSNAYESEFFIYYPKPS